MSDEADDDPQLKSLRAVWLALPDEDPPERGLAELMAAARVKAEQMTKQSLWQRIVALLRRPPVLALATVLVLIGGAVFIGQRSDKLASEPTADEPTAGENRSRDIIATGSATATAESPTTPAEPTLAPPAEPTLAPPVESKPKPSDAFHTHRPPARRPEPTNGVTRTEALALDKNKADQEAAKKEDAKKIDGTVKVGGAPHGTTVEAGRVDEKQSISGDSFAPAEDAIAAPEKDVRPSAGAPTTDRAQPPPAQSRAAQYVAQAKSAAARGDCTVARTMMKRVAKENASTYRNALAADSALKKCVGVAAQ